MTARRAPAARLRVVRARPAHAAAIAAVVRVLVLPGMRRPELAVIRRAIRDGEYFVALAGGEVAGAMALVIADGSAEIEALASRVPGAGRALVDFAVALCRRRRLPKLWCWSLARYRAGGFYRKLGFTERALLKKQWFGRDCWFFGRLIY